MKTSDEFLEELEDRLKKHAYTAGRTSGLDDSELGYLACCEEVVKEIEQFQAEKNNENKITVDKEEYDSLISAYEDLKLLDREHNKLQADCKRLNRLHKNVQAEIDAIKASIPTIKYHAALDDARYKIEYLESLYK